MRGKERHGVAHSLRHVIHHRIDACVFQVEVGIDVHYGVVAYLDAVVRVLEVELPDGRRVVRRVILGEVAHVGSQLHRQHLLRQLELQVEVAVERQVGQRQDVLVTALLVGDFIVPVEDAECQVFLQRGAQHLDVVAALAHPHVVTVAAVVGLGSIVKVSVVLDVFHTHVQLEARLLRLELPFYACAQLLGQIVVPPDVAGVIVAVVERRVDVLDVGVGCQLNGVLEQAEVEVGVARDVERAHFVARQGRFAIHAVVERLALLLQELAAHAEYVVRVFAFVAVLCRAQRVHHVVGAHLVVHESRQARLGPLVEPLAQGNGKGVLQRGVARDVALVFIAEEIVHVIVGRRFVGDVLPLVVVVAQRVDEARHGDEVVIVLGGVFRSLVESHVVAVGEEDVIVVVAVPRAFQVRGDVGGRVGGRRGDVFRTDDVAVVRDAAVFGHLHVVLAEQEVIVVLVALIGGEERAVEERRRLVVVHAAAVYVVKAEAEVQAPPRVHPEVGHEAVFAVLLVAAREVGQVGEGRLGVHEMILVHRHQEVVIRVGEDELRGRLAVEEDARQAGGADVAQVVVLAVEPVGELDVLELVHERVHGNLTPVTEVGVYRPHPDAHGHGFRVDRRCVLVQIVVVLINVARAVRRLFIELVVILGRCVSSEEGCQYREDKDDLFHTWEQR